MEKYVILNADDFGFSPSVNRGIIEAYRSGIVSSTTMMTNMPGFEDAVELAKREPELGVGVGLHFNLTFGAPLSPPERIPSLVKEDRQFWRIRADWVHWRAEDVAEELEAQWQRFIAAGLRPTHLDSHHHIQQVEAVYAPMVALAKREGIPMRRTFVGELLTSRFWHPPTTDDMIMDTYFQGDGQAVLLTHLKSLQTEWTEIVCHPGYVDEHVRRLSYWKEEREVELAVLRQPEIATAIRELGIERTHFGKLAEISKNS